MRFEKLLHRVSLDVIETFILSGDLRHKRASEKNFSERLQEASKKATTFLKHVTVRFLSMMKSPDIFMSRQPYTKRSILKLV